MAGGSNGSITGAVGSPGTGAATSAVNGSSPTPSANSPGPGITPATGMYPASMSMPPAGQSPPYGQMPPGNAMNNLAANPQSGSDVEAMLRSRQPGSPNYAPMPGGSPNGGSPFPPPPPASGGSSPAADGAASFSNDQGGHAAFIRKRAAELGIDPNFALSVASAEGLRAISPQNPNGASMVDRNPDGTPFSFGDFQLNVRNGLGTEARRHGIDPADPRQWQAADEYALQTMAKQGLQPWRGDAAVSAYQKQGGGWTPPPAGNGPAMAYGGFPTPPPAAGNGMGSSALAYGSAPPPPPAVAAINGTAGSAGGFAPPPGRGGFPPPPPQAGASGGGLTAPQSGSQGNPIGSALDGIASMLTGGSQQGQQVAQTAPASSGNPMVDRVRQLSQIAVSPYADPQTREMAGELLKTQMGLLAPQYQFVTRPDGSIEAINPRNPNMSVEAAGPMKQNQIIEGPVDPTTGYATKLLFNQNQGVIGVLRPDGSIAPASGATPPAGQQPQPPAGIAPLAIPPGVDPKKFRETLAERNASEVTPSAADELRFTQGLVDRQSYKEYSQSLPTWNAFTQHIQENSPAADKSYRRRFCEDFKSGPIGYDGRIRSKSGCAIATRRVGREEFKRLGTGMANLALTRARRWRASRKPK